MRFLLSALVLAFGSQAFAANFGMAGCGWGSMMFDHSGKGSQISAWTFNSSAANQAFGISSGTSNCLTADKAAAVNAQEQFFASNLQVLSKEMAQGNGEYVKALAKTMNCSEQVHGEFANEMQKNYSQIFAAPGAHAMLQRVRQSVRSNSNLSNSCDPII